MACVQIPTLTRTDVSTSESLFPTLSVFTSTGPSSLSTSTFRTCTQTNSSIPCRPTLTSSVVTVPGNVSLLTVSVTETIDVPITSLVTLFGSSCTTSSTPTQPSSTPPVTTSTPSSSSSTTSDQTTIIVSTSTPPPTVITSSSLVTSDGSTFVDVFTSTSSSPPTLVTTTGTSLSSSRTSTVPPTTTTTNLQIHTIGTILPNTGGGSHKKSSNTGPVVGGVLGGIAILAVIGVVTWKLIKKQSRFDDIFNKTSNSKPHYHKAKTEDPEPKPYNYGLVGQGGLTNPVGVGHASSTPNPTGHGLGGNDIGHQAQAANAVSQQGQTTNAIGHAGHTGTAHSAGQTGHGINNVGQSGQPGNTVGQPGQTANPVGHATGSQAANGLGQSGQGGNAVGQSAGHSIGYQPGNEIGAQSSQPSAAQHLSHLRNPSLTPLLGAVGVAAVAAGAGASMASSSRPSSSRPSSSGSSQPVGPLVSNAPPPSSYPPALQNWNSSQGYASQTGFAGSSSATNTQGYGAGPSMAGPSGLSQGAGSNNSVGSGSSGYGSSWGAGPSSSSGAAGGSFQPPLPGMIPLVATSMRRDNNTFSRPSQQNDDPFARTGSPVSIQEHRILQVTNAEPSHGSGIYDPHTYYSGRGGASSSSAAAGPSSSEYEGSHSGSSTDGKGRPLNLMGEKAALVHLDGGLYQEPSSEMPPPGPAPPAYTDP